MRRPAIEFTKAVRKAALQRADGHCEGPCGQPLRLGHFQFDHVIPKALGGTGALHNCTVLCKTCHSAKTLQRDTPTIAKAVRINEKLKDQRVPGKPLPAGRKSTLKKTLRGDVVPRVTQAEKHRELMHRRYGSNPEGETQ